MIDLAHEEALLFQALFVAFDGKAQPSNEDHIGKYHQDKHQDSHYFPWVVDVERQARGSTKNVAALALSTT
jgi:hypothetical protein